MTWQQMYQKRLVEAAEAVSGIRRGQRVFIGSGCAEPQELVAALAARSGELADTQIYHIMTLGIAPYTELELTSRFRHNAFFIGPNVREAVAAGRADYTPIFLSEIPRLFRRGVVPIDWALIQVSSPDEHGYCSYGVSVDIVKSAAESARCVIAEVNANMPRTLGDSFIHVSEIDYLVESEHAILETDHGEPDEVAGRIGKRIAELVEDGSTLQMGIGTIPDAVLACLTDKKDLGIHTEMFAEGVIPLVASGVINGARKNIHRGKIVGSFVMGTRRLYDFIDNNPLIELHPTEYTNDPFLIARHDRMVAINSALEIDLTGQVCSDSLGTYFYSGIGGQVDFIRGAARSDGGKPIIALPATAANGKVSRIVGTLKPGAGVVTSRGDVHYVVTEYGVADLHGKNIRERALALIHIAAPQFRESLMKIARERHFVYSDQVPVMGIGRPELDALETQMTARNGTVLQIRPVRPTDEELLRDGFYGLSSESIYRRFFAPLRSLPHEKLKAYANVDYDRDMALLAVAREGEREVMAAVGRYMLDPATQRAELAFLTRDEWQGQGIGTFLCKRLLEIARVRGIVKFTAEVLVENAPMLRLFHTCVPGRIESELDGNAYLLTWEIEPTRT